MAYHLIRIAAKIPVKAMAWRVTWVPLLLILAAYALLINHQSLSSDELFSVYFAAQDWHYLLNDGWRIEPNPPLYWLLLHGWMVLFGRSAIAIRILSLLAFAATLPMLGVIAHKCGIKNRPLAVTLFSLSALPGYYAITARSNALWTFLIALSILGLLQCLECGRSAERPSTKAFLWHSRWYAAGAVAALYTHVATVPYLMAANFVFLFAWLHHSFFRRTRTAINWCLLQLVVIAAAVPEISVIIGQIHTQSIAWIPQINVRTLLQVIVELFGGYFALARWFLLFPLLLLMGTLLAVATVRSVRNDKLLRDLIVLAVSGFIICVILSFDRPILTPSILLWLLIPVSVALASVIGEIELEWLRSSVAIGLLLILTTNTGAHLWDAPQGKWRGFLAVLSQKLGPSDVIVLAGDTPVTEIMYYLPNRYTGQTYRWISTRFPDSLTTSGAILDSRINSVPLITIPELEAMSPAGRVIWLVDRHSQPPDDELSAGRPFAQLIESAAVPSLRMQYVRTTVTRYVPVTNQH